MTRGVLRAFVCLVVAWILVSLAVGFVSELGLDPFARLASAVAGNGDTGYALYQVVDGVLIGVLTILFGRFLCRRGLPQGPSRPASEES